MKANGRKHEGTPEQPDALTRLLREADPAAADPELSAAEVARLRRQVTETARNHSRWHPLLVARPLWPRPALALVTTGIIVAGLWLGFSPRTAPPDPVATRASSPSPAPTPMNPETRNVETTVPAPQSVGLASGQTEPEPSSPTITEPGASEMTAATDDSPRRDVRARTVQFTAPRGTRIIWTLDPNFESPIDGHQAPQEQGK